MRRLATSVTLVIAAAVLGPVAADFLLAPLDAQELPSWTLPLARGHSGRSTVAVVNRCAGHHEFEVIPRVAPPWLVLEDPAPVTVPPGETVAVAVRVDSGSLQIGAYDGEVEVVCHSCAAAPLCSQDVDRLSVRLKVGWPEEILAGLSPAVLADSEELLAIVPPLDAGALRQLLRRWRRELGLREVDRLRLGLRPGVVLRLARQPSALGLAATVLALQDDPQVLWAQPLFRYRTAGNGKGDPYARRLWGATRLGLPEVHRTATGRGVRVAILDSGVDARHPDLADRVAKAANLTPGRGGPGLHGTAVAGIVGAVADNGVGIYGIAPGAELLSAKVCAEISAATGEAEGDSFTLARGLEQAALWRAQIVNLSLAGPEDPLIHTLVRDAAARGMTLVAAAGNLGGAEDAVFPAAYDEVIAVSSLGFDGTPFAGARQGEGIELLAPGEAILTTVPGDRFQPLTGSSFAAPHVSAAVALLLEVAPELSPSELRGVLRETAQAAGVVDLAAALKKAQQGAPIPP